MGQLAGRLSKACRSSFAIFRRMAVPLLVLGIIILVCYFAALQFLEWQQAASSLKAVDKRIQAQNEALRTLAQVLGGTFFLITAYFTWRTVRSSERNVAILLEGQITERFTKAIEQLGDSTSLAKRLGGIYALERIARDNPKDHWQIMEVLTAYVRENVPRKEKWEQLDLATRPRKEKWEHLNPATGAFEPDQQVIRPPTDIQAILTVLGRCTLRYRHGEENRLALGQYLRQP